MTLVLQEHRVPEVFKDVFYQDEISSLWPPKLLLCLIFELDIDHGISCNCCTPIPKPITTCPLKADQLKSKPRGRPRMKAESGSEFRR